VPENRRKLHDEKTDSATKKSKNAQRESGTADYANETDNRRKSPFARFENIWSLHLIRCDFYPLLTVLYRVFSCIFVAMKFLNNQWFLLGLRIIIGGIFVYAGITKIQNPQAFADSIATFQMLPPQVTNIVTLGLPPFEVLIGLMLIAGWHVRASSLAVIGLSVVFGIALGQAIARGLVVDCGCFGSGEPSILKTWASFGRAVILLICSLWIYMQCLLLQIGDPKK